MGLGAHMPISGGLHIAPLLGKQAGCEVIQIFTKNSTQWREKRFSRQEIDRFSEALKDTGVTAAAVHASYLINLAHPGEAEWRRSAEAFFAEMERTEALGIPYLVVHPGAHLGSGEDAGCARVSEALNLLLARTSGWRVVILLETSAGQGTAVGYRFEHFKTILTGVREPERVGICYDTCHVFAAGYDIRTEEGYRRTMEECERHAGAHKILAFHFNDSKKGVGCRVDRHEHIGKGAIGLVPFRCILSDPRFLSHPKILETPKGDDLAEDIMNLAVLRGLVSVSPSLRA